VQLSADGLLVAGGAHGLATDQARRLRAAAAEDRPGRALVALLDQLRSEGFTVEGERLKRVPPELPKDSPRADLLTLKTLWAARHLEPGPWLHRAEAAEVVATAWRQVTPLNDWLAEHVGASRVVQQR
jgi:hypothetical protein